MDNFEVERINVLTRDTYYQATYDLHAGLPPPATDDPGKLHCRDNAAMAEVVALAPANAEEVKLAVLYVTAGAQAIDSLRADSKTGMDAVKRRAQFASMMRQATGARSLLLRVQAARLKREASNPATDAAAWIEYIGLNHMAKAMGRSWAGPPEERPEARPEEASGAGTVAQACATVAANPAAQAPASDLSPAHPASGFETKSQGKGNETDTRRDCSASSIDKGLDSLPPKQDVSTSETVSQQKGNETAVRRNGPVSAADEAPRSAANPSNHANLPAVAWPGETLSRSDLPRPMPISGSDQPLERTIGPPRRHPDADGAAPG